MTTRTALVAALAAALVATLPVVPSSPASASPASVPRTTAAPPEDGEVASTAADLAASRARLADLQARADAMTDELSRSRALLSVRAAEAALALEQYSSTVRVAQAARAAESRERERLLRARLDLAEQRQVLGRFARSLYAEPSGTLSQSPALVTVLTAGSAADLPGTMEVLRRAGRVKGRAVAAMAQAQAEQAAAVESSARATAEADAPAVTAADARTTADAAVAEQRSSVEAQAELLLAARDDSAAAADAVATAQAAADAAAARAAALDAQAGAGEPSGASGGGLVGPVGDCPGGDVSGYLNGRLPVELLCPLYGAPGHRLRADAAFAWNQLSRRYAEVFGAPTCVTDSYRTYEAQVDVARRKPGLAAVPGTSNHGWATAVDLCGGIESFGTPQHDWLVANGPLFGWFHPAWAEPSGSRPEPWHFEYGG